MTTNINTIKQLTAFQLDVSVLSRAVNSMLLLLISLLAIIDWQIVTSDIALSGQDERHQAATGRTLVQGKFCTTVI